MSEVRAKILTRRTYSRPLDKEGKRFEKWSQTIDRNIDHQRWLWENAIGDDLNKEQEAELTELRSVLFNRQASVSGRSLWLGGTEIVKRRAASCFNCSFLDVRTVHDVVDAFWLLLQGCGVGFRPCNGTLSGFTRKMEVEIIRSTRTGKGGDEHNKEHYDQNTRTWTIVVGDSAEAWAKSIGKLLGGKFPAKKVVFDLSQIRPPGERLHGYGWICSGDEQLSVAVKSICDILNKCAGKLLRKNDIIDIVNWLGTVLSSRRSAQIALMDYGDPEWREFAARKKKGFDSGPNWFRGQSNNSLIFWDRPTKKQLDELFDMMIENGGSEPGFINGVQATMRAPWFKGVNPCSEILLPDKGFCNLVEIPVSHYKDDFRRLIRNTELMARANYRQTVVNLLDGVLQHPWHQQNEYLRLCGVGLTGIACRPDLLHHDYLQIKNSAVHGAYTMADELGLERPKNVTCLKPSGTLSKAIFNTTEGAHKPKGRYLFNTVGFSKLDPTVNYLIAAGYRVNEHPYDKSAVLVVFPVHYPDVQLDSWNGYEVDRESAVTQLRRYKMLQRSYVEQNTSITVSYDREEKNAMVKEIISSWDDYVACSFLFRDNPTLTAEDLGYAYMPQRAVSKKEYDDYADTIMPIDIDEIEENGFFELEGVQECAGGACPVK